MKALSDPQRVILMRSWRDGLSILNAALAADCGQIEAKRAFRQFAFAGIRRQKPQLAALPHVPTRLRPPQNPRKGSYIDALPRRYYGPSWIGERITEPDKPVHNGSWVW